MGTGGSFSTMHMKQPKRMLVGPFLLSSLLYTGVSALATDHTHGQLERVDELESQLESLLELRPANGRASPRLRRTVNLERIGPEKSMAPDGTWTNFPFARGTLETTVTVPVDTSPNSFNKVGIGEYETAWKTTIQTEDGPLDVAITEAFRQDKQDQELAGLQQEISKEAYIMNFGTLGPNVLLLYGSKFYETEDPANGRYVSVSDLCQGGALANVVFSDQDDKPFREKEYTKSNANRQIEARQLMYQALLGLGVLHSMHIAHMDLSLQNILLVQKHFWRKSTHPWEPAGNVKITGFGFATRYGDMKKKLCGVGGEGCYAFPVTDARAQYMAPELLRFEEERFKETESYQTPLMQSLADAKQDKKRSLLPTDVYSMGVIWYRMLSQGAWDNNEKPTLFTNIPLLPQRVNKEARDRRQGSDADVTEAFSLIEKMVASDPDDRPTVEALLADPYFEVERKHFGSLRTGGGEYGHCIRSAPKGEDDNEHCHLVTEAQFDAQKAEDVRNKVYTPGTTCRNWHRENYWSPGIPTRCENRKRVLGFLGVGSKCTSKAAGVHHSCEGMKCVEGQSPTCEVTDPYKKD